MAEVAGYIQRKTMLYRTGVEYGDYTINFVQGCAHGCKYPCYAFAMKKRFGQVRDYGEWCKPYLVSNTLELLDKEIPKLQNKICSVHLCFSTDPFMYGFDEICQMGIAAIAKLNASGIKCTVLTKGLLPSCLANLSKENEYGITLISLDEDYRERIEPGAAPYADRIAALRVLHEAGCKTWVSMEHTPRQTSLSRTCKQFFAQSALLTKLFLGGPTTVKPSTHTFSIMIFTTKRHMK